MKDLDSKEIDGAEMLTQIKKACMDNNHESVRQGLDGIESDELKRTALLPDPVPHISDLFFDYLSEWKKCFTNSFAITSIVFLSTWRALNIPPCLETPSTPNSGRSRCAPSQRVISKVGQ